MFQDQLNWTEVYPEIQQCIQNCLICHSMCLDTITYCLQNRSKYQKSAHIRLLLDCAEICQTSANFMLRESSFFSHTCAICAIICDRCAQESETFIDDAKMQSSAAVCRQCAQSCRHIALEMESITKTLESNSPISCAQ
jgi:hypothetical protein